MRKLWSHAYLIGIAGTGMSALATILQTAGVTVEGADEDFSPPTGPLLETLDLTLHRGYSPDHIPEQADLIVVGNALSKNNPEVQTALRHRAGIWSMPSALFSLWEDRERIVVAGTHGKSTTTAVIAWLLQELGASPGWMIGAIPRFGLPGVYGKGPVVIEGDEYSSSFFDRNPKFLHYYPHHLVIPVVEFDHLDMYPDLLSIEREFQHLIRLLPPGGTLLLSEESESFRSFAPPGVHCLTLREHRFTVVKMDPYGVEFLLDGESFVFPFSGKQMATDAGLAVLLVKTLLGSSAGIADALSRYPGLLRRQEILLSTPDRIILWDFGHHPTEVERTIEGLRASYPGTPLIVVFEPRSYTSRTSRFQERYREVFRLADFLYLAPVYRPERLSHPALDTVALASDHPHGRAFSSYEELKVALSNDLLHRSPPWILVFFSNGTLGGIPYQIAEELLS